MARRSTSKTREPAKTLAESSITSLDGGRLYYRGYDAAELARDRSLEDVASLLWTGDFGADVFDTPLHVIAGRSSTADLPFLNRAQSVLPLVAARDTSALDLKPRAVAQTGWRIMNLLTSVAVSTQQLEQTIEDTLATRWGTKHANAPALLRAALILCADHGSNVSTITARSIASAGANPYSVVLGGLAALDGGSGRTEAGDDPRARGLLSLLGARKSARGGEHANLDSALVALSRALSLPDDAPVVLFAIGRTMGWIAHAIEQYAQNDRKAAALPPHS